MIKASIDIGSNSILCLIARVENEKVVEVLQDESRITGLGRGLDKTKKFCAEAMNDSLEAFESYKALMDQYKITSDNITATATEAARVAQNSQEFFLKVKERYGIEVKIISGDDEARYSTLGIAQSIQEEEVFLMDVGGASTEFIQANINPFKILYSISLPMGSVRATDWETDNCFDQNINKALSELKSELFNNKTIIGCAGTFVSIACMLKNQKSFNAKEVEGMKIIKNDLDSLLNIIKDDSPTEILNKYPLIGKRSNNIKGGIKLILKALNYIDSNSIQVSTLGLRYATII